MPCPMAISAPAVFCFEAFSIVTANRGPGKRTPDIEMNATETRNKLKSPMTANLFQLHIVESSAGQFKNILDHSVFTPSLERITATTSVLSLAAA